MSRSGLAALRLSARGDNDRVTGPVFRRDLYQGTAGYYDRFRLPYPQALTDDLAHRSGADGTGRLLDLRRFVMVKIVATVMPVRGVTRPEAARPPSLSENRGTIGDRVIFWPGADRL